MIVIKLQGGLGNQLFQYLAYQRLCEFHDDVYFDVGDYNLPYNDGYRKFDLDSFSTLKLKFVLFTDSLKKKFKYRLLNTEVRILKSSVKKGLVYITSEETSDMDSDLHQIPDNSYVEDWFSRERFVSSFSKLFFYFKPAVICKNKSLKRAFEIISNDNSVSVHIRRGDYLLEAGNYGGICTPKYYSNAMLYFNDLLDNPVFYIFSDDIDFCKKKFQNDNIKFVDTNFYERKNSTVEDLFLMSCCKHNIIANSTYSWWGAYFNRNPKKIVICPPVWSNKSKSSEIFPSSWIRGKNE